MARLVVPLVLPVIHKGAIVFRTDGHFSAVLCLCCFSPTFAKLSSRACRRLEGDLTRVFFLFSMR